MLVFLKGYTCVQNLPLKKPAYPPSPSGYTEQNIDGAFYQLFSIG